MSDVWFSEILSFAFGITVDIDTSQLATILDNISSKSYQNLETEVKQKVHCLRTDCVCVCARMCVLVVCVVCIGCVCCVCVCMCM